MNVCTYIVHGEPHLYEYYCVNVLIILIAALPGLAAMAFVALWIKIKIVRCSGSCWGAIYRVLCYPTHLNLFTKV